MSEQSTTELIYRLVTLSGRDNVFHAYLVCEPADRERALQAIVEEMMNIAVQEKVAVVPSVLSTFLREDGRAMVEGIIMGLDKRFHERLRGAKLPHRCVWMMSNQHPDNQKLMELH